MPRDLLPPHSIEAEQAVLGAALISRNGAEIALAALEEHDFYHGPHRDVFAAVGRLVAAGMPADIQTVPESLRDAGALDRVGGPNYIVQLAESVPTAAHTEHYARIVADKSALRRLIEAGQKVAQLGYSADVEPQEAQRQAQAIVHEATDKRRKGDGPLPTSALVVQHMASVEQGEVPGLHFGLSALQGIAGTMKPGELVLVGGRPGSGKSALGCTFVPLQVAMSGVPVLVFSEEMTREQITSRCISALSLIPYEQIDSRRVPGSQVEHYSRGISRFADLPIFVDDGELTIEDIRATSRRYQRTHGVGLIVIDHLQAVPFSDSRQTVREGNSHICKQAKRMAKELNLPVMLLAQLSRKVEDRPNKRPELSDFRETGTIEEEADKALLIYREGYYHPETMINGAGAMEINVAKNRGGRTGVATVIAMMPTCQFEDYGAAGVDGYAATGYDPFEED